MSISDLLWLATRSKRIPNGVYLWNAIRIMIDCVNYMCNAVLKFDKIRTNNAIFNAIIKDTSIIIFRLVQISPISSTYLEDRHKWRRSIPPNENENVSLVMQSVISNQSYIYSTLMQLTWSVSLMGLILFVVELTCFLYYWGERDLLIPVFHGMLYAS